MQTSLGRPLPDDFSGKRFEKGAPRARIFAWTLFTVLSSGFCLLPMRAHATACKDDFTGASAKQLSECINELRAQISELKNAAPSPSTNGSVISAGEIRYSADSQNFQLTTYIGVRPTLSEGSKVNQFNLGFGDKLDNAILIVSPSSKNAAAAEAVAYRDGAIFRVRNIKLSRGSICWKCLLCPRRKMIGLRWHVENRTAATPKAWRFDHGPLSSVWPKRALITSAASPAAPCLRRLNQVMLFALGRKDGCNHQSQ